MIYLPGGPAHQDMFDMKPDAPSDVASDTLPDAEGGVTGTGEYREIPIQAVYRAVYMEMNARLQADAMRLGDPVYLTEGEARLAEAAIDGQVQRPWELWVREVTEASG